MLKRKTRKLSEVQSRASLRELIFILHGSPEGTACQPLHIAFDAKGVKKQCSTARGCQMPHRTGELQAGLPKQQRGGCACLVGRGLGEVYMRIRKGNLRRGGGELGRREKMVYGYEDWSRMKTTPRQI